MSKKIFNLLSQTRPVIVNN